MSKAERIALLLVLLSCSALMVGAGGGPDCCFLFVEGIVFNDLNGNGVQDPGEPVSRNALVRQYTISGALSGPPVSAIATHCCPN